MNKKFARYHASISYLEGLANLPLAGDYLIGSHNAYAYLKRMRSFLRLLGNPDHGMTFVHIGGTSGKGSVTNLLHEMLFASGKNVGSFSSPSVTTTIEKIRVGDLYIAPDEFADIVEELKPFIDEAYVRGRFGRPSYFEIIFAIALVYFKRKKCDIVILEVGLGGRYDATNVIKRPIMTAITNIDYDHTELLGKTLTKIAYDKAGIIKQGSLFFTSEQRSSLIRLFQRACAEKQARMICVPRQQNYREENRMLATMMAQKLGVDNVSIARGIRRAHLPCRFEQVQFSPTVILDGAHNRAKIKSTKENLSQLHFNKLILVIGIANNKDHQKILSQIIPLADSILFTRFQTKDRASASPKELLAKSKRLIKKQATTLVLLDASRALSQALAQAGKQDLVLVTGSFYLAGELRKRWIPEESILRTRKSGVCISTNNVS